MSESLALLERLVAFPSVARMPNAAIADFAGDHLSAHGFAVTRLLDASGERSGLVARMGAGEGGVLLSGHMDVVPVVGQDWTRDPFRLTREGDKLYGRGTTDMKGYVASMLALAARAAKAPLQEPLALVLSYDEEVGCIGISEMLPALPALIGTPRACFVGEPTEMQVATGHKGKAALRAICHGEAGHSALAPQFDNALHRAADFVTGLRDLQEALAKSGARDAAYDVPYSTVHVGQLQGGTALNIVPDRAELVFEYRHLAADTPEALRARIDAVAARIGGIEITETNAYPGLETEPDTDVVRAAQRLARSNGTTKVAFGTEAGFFAQLGVPTVVCGPGSMAGQGHKPDEYIEASQLAACDAMMDRILQDISL